MERGGGVAVTAAPVRGASAAGHQQETEREVSRSIPPRPCWQG